MKEERKKHLHHVVHHIEDVKESAENDDEYKELKAPANGVIDDAEVKLKKFFESEVTKWANQLKKDDKTA